MVAAGAIAFVVNGQAYSQEVTNQSAVGQGLCSTKNYWFQGLKLKDGTLCTKFSFNQFFSVPILWDPAWNAEARKRYCPGSEKDPCFIK